jgi:hypothetical protein
MLAIKKSLNDLYWIFGCSGIFEKIPDIIEIIPIWFILLLAMLLG